MFNRILFLALPLLGQAQLISMNVCEDNSCSKGCVSWTMESGKCSPCDSKKGVCSALNPSSVTTTNSLTFYSDSVCAPANVIQGYANIPITLDNSCNRLVVSGSTVGSYRAANLSLSIGLSVALSLTFILCCVCCCWKQKCCCFRPTPGSTATDSSAPAYYPTNTTVGYPAQDLPYNSNVTVAVPASWPNNQYNTTVVPAAPPYYPAGYGYPINTNATYAVPPPVYPMQNAYPVQNGYGPGVAQYHGYGYPNNANQTIRYEDPTQPKAI